MHNKCKRIPQDSKKILDKRALKVTKKLESCPKGANIVW